MNFKFKNSFPFQVAFRKTKKGTGKPNRITGVKAMGGHLYWHECRVETILDD